MSYVRDKHSRPEAAPDFRVPSNYVSVDPVQYPVGCLPTALDAAAAALGAAKSCHHAPVRYKLQKLVQGRGIGVEEFLQALPRLAPHLRANLVNEPKPQPTSELAYVLIIPGPPGRRGHAVAMTHQHGAGVIWDSDNGGAERPLEQAELERWSQAGAPVITVEWVGA